MTKYRVIYHCHVGTEYEVEADSPDEAAETSREMWCRAEAGELLYDEVDRVEITVEPFTTTES